MKTTCSTHLLYGIYPKRTSKVPLKQFKRRAFRFVHSTYSYSSVKPQSYLPFLFPYAAALQASCTSTLTTNLIFESPCCAYLVMLVIQLGVPAYNDIFIIILLLSSHLNGMAFPCASPADRHFNLLTHLVTEDL